MLSKPEVSILTGFGSGLVLSFCAEQAEQTTQISATEAGRSAHAYPTVVQIVKTKL